MPAWQVKLPRFEGPLDLLLFLVTRQELDILDLPIAKITEQYLQVIDTMGIDSLEDAGEYLLMSATLIAIKARMMLPRPEVAAEEEMEDPRLQLARRLLLYQQVKQAAGDLGEREEAMAQRSMRLLPALPVGSQPPPEDLLERVSLYDLANAYDEVRRRFEELTVHEVTLFKVSLEERMAWILEQLKDKLRFSFMTALRVESARVLWIVSFLAVLELARRRKIVLEQNLPFSDLWVCQAQESTVEAV